MAIQMRSKKQAIIYSIQRNTVHYSIKYSHRDVIKEAISEIIMRSS